MSSAVRETDREPTAAARRPGVDLAELALSVLLAALGVYLLVGAGSITVPGSANTLGPRFFPYLVGGLTTAVGVLLAVRIARGDRGPEEGGEDIDPTVRPNWLAVAVIAVAFAAHALLINVVGWPLAVTLMFAVVAWSLQSRRPDTRWDVRGLLRPIAVGGVLSVVVWVVFARGLDVAMPGGVLLEAATGWLG